MEKELYHHGIEGQKWGKRHGPPYPLDRSESRAIKKQAKALAKQEKILRKRGLTSKAASKYAKQLTDEQLNDIIDRLKREDTYKNLVKKPGDESESKSTNEKAADKKALKQVAKANDPNSFKNTTKSILSSGAKTLAAAGIKKLADDMFAKEEVPDIKWTMNQEGKFTANGTGKDINKLFNLADQIWEYQKKDRGNGAKAQATSIKNEIIKEIAPKTNQTKSSVSEPDIDWDNRYGFSVKQPKVLAEKRAENKVTKDMNDAWKKAVTASDFATTMQEITTPKKANVTTELPPRPMNKWEIQATQRGLQFSHSEEDTEAILNAIKSKSFKNKGGSTN
ncbi:MAG: hypothetical protein J6U54_05625 [Clostridiales bacterium]|nr:hypothetical protein [Clostridiales bacterium]